MKKINSKKTVPFKQTTHFQDQFLETSFSNQLPWVLGLARSFSNILTLITPFDTKKTCNLPIPLRCFIFILQTTIIGTETLIYKNFRALRKVYFSRIQYLRSSLTRKIWRLSFLLKWTPSLSKTLKTLASDKSLGIGAGIRTTSKHSRLEYCALVQLCLYVSVSWLTSFSFTFLTIETSASTFFICVTRSLISDVSSFISAFIFDSSWKKPVNLS